MQAHNQGLKSGVQLPGVVVGLILVGCMGQVLLFTALPPVLPMLAAHLGGGERGAFIAQQAAMVAAVGLIFGSLVGGWFISRVKLRPVMGCAAVLYGVFGTAGFWIDDPVVLIGSRLMLGLACTALTTISMLLISAIEDHAERDRIIGFQTASGFISALLSYMLSGAIADIFGWRYSFFLYFVLAVFIVALLALTSADQFKRKEDKAVEGEGPTVNGAWSLWPVYVTGCLLYIVFLSVNNQLPFVMEKAETGLFARTVALGANTLAGMVVCLLYSRLCKIFSQKTIMQGGLSFLAVGLLMFTVWPSFTGFTVGAMFAGVGTGLIVPGLYSRILGQVPSQAQGLAIGLYLSSTYAGAFLNPFVMNLFGPQGFMVLSVMLTTAVISRHFFAK